MLHASLRVYYSFKGQLRILNLRPHFASPLCVILKWIWVHAWCVFTNAVNREMEDELTVSGRWRRFVSGHRYPFSSQGKIIWIPWKVFWMSFAYFADQIMKHTNISTLMMGAPRRQLLIKICKLIPIFMVRYQKLFSKINVNFSKISIFMSR